jgi:malonate transporter and related proteins
MNALVNIVLPIFGVIAAGFVAGRGRLLGLASSEALNGFVYYFALPALLFLSMARTHVADIVNVPFIAAILCGEFVVFALVAIVGRRVFASRPAAQAVAALAGIFANTGYMGIPFFFTAFGAAGTLPAVIATVVTSAVIIGAAVVIIELDLSTRGGFSGAFADALKALIVNPLVLAPLAGIGWGASGIGIPVWLATFGDLLGAAAGPCALFAIGLFLASRPLADMLGGRRTAEIAWLVAVKLIVHPLVTWGLALAFGLSGFWAGAAALITALPTGSLAFVVATRYGVQVELASAVILVSTGISVATLTILLLLLGPIAP